MFESKQILKFYEADPAGVIFYGNAFSHIHSALEDLLRSRGVYDLYFRNPDYAFPVKTASADYKKPLSPGEEIVVSMQMVRIGESSFEIEYDIKNSDGILAATANTVHVCISKKTGGKSALLPEILDVLNDI